MSPLVSTGNLTRLRYTGMGTIAYDQFPIASSGEDPLLHVFFHSKYISFHHIPNKAVHSRQIKSFLKSLID